MKKEKNTTAPKKERNFSKITGILQLFVLVSVAYSTYVVYLGTEGIAPKVMLVPQAIFAAVIAVQKFTK